MLKDRVQIMGILNLTPDSFSDGGKFCTLENALKQAEKLIKDGADIIDIGAESTRPGSLEVPADEELNRLMPTLIEIRKNFKEIKISIDTYKGTVAQKALENGADIINDVWGGMRSIFFSEKTLSTLKVAKEFGCKIILMHNRPKQMPAISELKKEIFSDFNLILENAVSEGIVKDNIILDGGFGFAKTPAQNLELLKNYESLRSFACPLLLGLSKKSTLKQAFGEDNLDDATLAFDIFAVANKACDIIRVHDVARHKTFLDSISLIASQAKWTK